MRETVFILKDENEDVIEVYSGKNKDQVKKLLPHIESKLLKNISHIDEVLLNPPIDLVGNVNFKKRFTIKAFMDS